MNDTIIQHLDCTNDESLITEYNVIRSLCDEYIKECRMGSYILEDGESSKTEDKQTKAPSLLEKAINFIRRLIIRLKSTFTMTRLRRYIRFYDRNIVALMTILEDDEGNSNGKTIDDCYIVKESFVQKAILLLSKFNEVTSDEMIDAITYSHNVKYSKIIGKLSSVKEKVDKLYDEYHEIDMALTKDIDDISPVASKYSHVFQKIKVTDKSDYRSTSVWTRTLESQAQHIFYNIKETEKNIKDAKEVEKLFNDEKDDENVSYYTKYITEYVVIMNKLAMITMSACSISAKVLKVACHKAGVKNIGSIEVTGTKGGQTTLDSEYDTTTNFTKKAGISKKERSAMS